jgi:hypothetical protein
MEIHVHQPRYDKTRADAVRDTFRRAHVVGLVAILGLVAALGLSMMPPADSARPTQPSIATAPPAAPDPAQFILNALLVPALDPDAAPLRWVDPRPRQRCGPGTTVLVNGEPLRAGALVPDTPFELEWQADGCRPFGAHGPRFEGSARLTVFREDWGFSAMVETSTLRAALAGREITSVRPGVASLPQCLEASEPYERTIGAERSRACR